MRGCEAETSHLLCCRTEAEQPSVPESVLTYTFSSEKCYLDNRLQIIQSAITDALYLNIHCTAHTLHPISVCGKICQREEVIYFSFSMLNLF